MPLPLTIQKLFDDNHTARLKSLSEANCVQTALRLAALPYQTKIVKSRRNGRTFVVTLLEPQSHATGH
jgi:hypothetical protein